jgi:hypothetical protein
MNTDVYFFAQLVLWTKWGDAVRKSLILQFWAVILDCVFVCVCVCVRARVSRSISADIPSS